MRIEEIIHNKHIRHLQFPITEHHVYLAHAGVTALPRACIEAIQEFLTRSTSDMQENDWAWDKLNQARCAASKMLGCTEHEIALLGPTSLGLNLVANGLSWHQDDEIIYYPDDYPANVYPWKNLQRKGVKPIALQPQYPGKITWSLIEPLITRKTRMLALASCHYLSGYRIDLNAIGEQCNRRGILFCVDAIQSLGASPVNVRYIDFLSADSHKWMLGPAGAGIFYVKASCQELLQPSLLGSWNVISPNFIAQNTINFENTARRYEPGTLNLPGIIGMLGSLNLLLDIGIDQIYKRILDLRQYILETLCSLGYRPYIEDNESDPETTDNARSGIISFIHPGKDMRNLYKNLLQANCSVSLRQDRHGQELLRLSPHFYNTFDEIDKLSELL
ncbi:MAG: aminotransferase class V-fold PLP-dependent enzyme [Chlamydiota bacterium]|nr:aminotransferase class V-fold PLP-dependent enzyme [Chlamydiota bacterium]